MSFLCNITKPPSRGRPRSVAMTLLELLVVVSIVVVLLAASVPLLKPALENGKIREASRQLNVFMQVARARAIESGRTTAVMIERSEPGSDISYQLYIAQSPLPYTGDVVAAKATSFAASVASPTTIWRVEFRDGISANSSVNSATLPAIARIGDFIKFDYKGHLYKITSIAALGSHPMWAEVDVSENVLPPNLEGLNYQIFRQPVKSIASPLQLTGGVAIDLEFSGIGATVTYDASGNELTGREFRKRSAGDNSAILIGFGPSGSVDHVTDSTGTYYPDGVIHLLLGRQEHVGVAVDSTPETPVPLQVTSGISSVPQPYTKNVPSSSSIWVSIAPRTGAVGTAENAWALANASTPSGQINFADSFRLAREFAQAGQLAGGN